MAIWKHTVSGRLLDSTSSLGYPWIEVDPSEPIEIEKPVNENFELAVKTAAKILEEVGDDPVLAQAALDAELNREFPPRKVLTADLRRIIRNGES
jgi:hypothetical protein